MDHKGQEQIALHRWAVIAEAAGDRLTARRAGGAGPPDRRPRPRAPGRVVPHATRGARSTAGCGPGARAGWRRSSPRRGPTPAWSAPTRSCSPRPPRCGWSCPAARPRRSPRSCITGTGSRSSERTVRGQLRRAGLHREALAAEPKAYGRYEAARPNERWITDVLVGPWVPWPRREGSVRARLFLIVDDHSRLLVDGRFFAHENARACQDLLRRAITRRGLPEVFYADNGAPFSNAWLARTCGVLGIRLVHSKPYSPEGRGKQERLNRYIREAFLAEATHQGIESLDALNDLFAAWAEQVRQPAGARRDRADPDRPVRGRRAAPPGRSRTGCARRSAGRSPAGSPAPRPSRWRETPTPSTRRCRAAGRAAVRPRGPDPHRGVPGRQARRGRDPVRHPPPRAPRRPAGRPPRPGPHRDRLPGPGRRRARGGRRHRRQDRLHRAGPAHRRRTRPGPGTGTGGQR